jgi:hypothetical protein
VNERRQRLLLSVACGLALFGLALMVWSIFDPRPIPVVIAMSVGQGVGTLSLLLYLFVVIADLRKAKVLDKDDK